MTKKGVCYIDVIAMAHCVERQPLCSAISGKKSLVNCSLCIKAQLLEQREPTCKGLCPLLELDG